MRELLYLIARFTLSSICSVLFIFEHIFRSEENCLILIQPSQFTFGQCLHDVSSSMLMILFYFFFHFFIIQMNLSHLQLYNDHNNLISQDFHPTAQAHPPNPQTVSSGDHRFFNVCELASVLQRSSVCPFFQMPHVSESIGCWCLIVQLTSFSMIISRSIHVAKKGQYFVPFNG